MDAQRPSGKRHTGMSARLIYRWGVFLLAGGYTIRMVLLSDYDGGLGPFRYLTIWALLASFFAASRMIAIEEGRTERRWDAVVAMTAVLNAMVVILYWRLYLDDPASVTRTGQREAWYLDYYLHGLGPVLQIIDALFLHRAFRRPAAAAGCLGVVIASYIAWAELVVQRVHDGPEGTVTSGLPYPFLNNMAFGDRLVFYGGNFAAALVLLALFTALGWGVSRLGARRRGAT